MRSFFAKFVSKLLVSQKGTLKFVSELLFTIVLLYFCPPNELILTDMLLYMTLLRFELI